jgi:hypothetical protein
MISAPGGVERDVLECMCLQRRSLLPYATRSALALVIGPLGLISTNQAQHATCYISMNQEQHANAAVVWELLLDSCSY